MFAFCALFLGNLLVCVVLYKILRSERNLLSNPRQ